MRDQGDRLQEEEEDEWIGGREYKHERTIFLASCLSCSATSSAPLPPGARRRGQGGWERRAEAGQGRRQAMG
eukprot:392628-Hanusia_phi.AAC.1